MTSYIPHSEADREAMMKAIGIGNVGQLFVDIPQSKIVKGLLPLPSPMPEMELRRHMTELSAKNQIPRLSFAGAGAYHHFIPSAVNHIISRSEFFTAYTPYQPEISQGSLQVMYEFQTMIAHLAGMEVANASMYDGSSALAEAATLACISKKRNKVLISRSVHPEYRDVVKTYMRARNFELVEVGIKDGSTDLVDLQSKLDTSVAAVIVQSPNFFGVIENQERGAELAHNKESFFISCVVEGMSLGILKSPGECGADFFVGEGQSFGISPSYGGPNLGLFAVREEHIRKIPGRLVGKTVDMEGRDAYVLTLQAREQHIRREKACSNICTNQGLMAIAATVYLSTVGVKLGDIAYQNMQKNRYARDTLPGKPVFDRPTFNEFVLRIPDAKKKHELLVQRGILAGVLLEDLYPELKDCLLVCCTELTTKNDIDSLAAALGDVQ